MVIVLIPYTSQPYGRNTHPVGKIMADVNKYGLILTAKGYEMSTALLASKLCSATVGKHRHRL